MNDFIQDDPRYVAFARGASTEQTPHVIAGGEDIATEEYCMLAADGACS